MLHSFYMEIEKILKIIAREWDGFLPASESWHRDLLVQMSDSIDRLLSSRGRAWVWQPASCGTEAT
jgi:hypothetical protein